MTRILMTLALTVATLTSVTTAKAAEHRGDNSGSKAGYNIRYGTKFSHGYFYAGREHRQWTSCYFDERFGSYLYLCPSTQTYYYWCERDVCFFPISYCPYENYGFAKECVCSTCPVVCPTHRPVCPKPICKEPSGGFKNTIHPIISSTPVKPITGTLPYGGVPVKPIGGTLPNGGNKVTSLRGSSAVASAPNHK